MRDFEKEAENTDGHDEPSYESGPFCKHWGDPGCCDDLCKCDHKCCEHREGPCSVEGCHCEGFIDAV